MPDEQSGHARWLQALERLEADLAAGSTGAEGWSAPEQLGPLPPALAARARQLLAAQREAILELERAQRATGRHLAAIRSVPAAQRTGQSVYLDVTG